jgi:hypothetical protein
MSKPVRTEHFVFMVFQIYNGIIIVYIYIYAGETLYFWNLCGLFLWGFGCQHGQPQCIHRAFPIYLGSVCLSFKIKLHNWSCLSIVCWLVVLTILKSISPWEGLSHILWKITHVWNHQPVWLNMKWSIHGTNLFTSLFHIRRCLNHLKYQWI